MRTLVALAALGLAASLTLVANEARSDDFGPIGTDRVRCQQWDNPLGKVRQNAIVWHDVRGWVIGKYNDIEPIQHYMYSMDFPVKLGNKPVKEYTAVQTGIWRENRVCLKVTFKLRVPYNGERRVELFLQNDQKNDMSSDVFYRVNVGDTL